MIRVSLIWVLLVGMSMPFAPPLIRLWSTVTPDEPGWMTTLESRSCARVRLRASTVTTPSLARPGFCARTVTPGRALVVVIEASP